MPYSYEIKKRELVKNNPTEYVFDVPAIKISNYLKKKLDEILPSDDITSSYGSDLAFVEQKNIAKKFTDISNDIFVYYAHSSLLYYASDNMMPLRQITTLYIHIEKISAKKTKVLIVNPKTEIDYGQNLIVKMGPKIAKVESTTIESYHILKNIGEHFKISGMPEIILPNEILGKEIIYGDTSNSNYPMEVSIMGTIINICPGNSDNSIDIGSMKLEIIKSDKIFPDEYIVLFAKDARKYKIGERVEIRVKKLTKNNDEYYFKCLYNNLDSNGSPYYYNQTDYWQTKKIIPN